MQPMTIALMGEVVFTATRAKDIDFSLSDVVTGISGKN